MKTYNIPLVTSVPMNTTINSPAMQLRNMFGYNIQAWFTATPTGTLKLQASSDPEEFGPPNNFIPTNWTDVANSSVSISASGNFMWNVFDVSYNWARMVYTDASGGTSTALLTAVFNGKGI